MIHLKTISVLCNCRTNGVQKNYMISKVDLQNPQNVHNAFVKSCCGGIGRQDGFYEQKITFILSKGYFSISSEPSQKCAQQEDDFLKSLHLPSIQKPICTKYPKICQWRSLKPCSVLFGEGTHPSSKSVPALTAETTVAEKQHMDSQQ